MMFEMELQFLQSILEKCHVACRVLAPHTAAPGLDHGLRRQLGLDEEDLTGPLLTQCEQRVLYKYTDQFLSSYLSLRLPDEEQERVLVIGPYMAVEASWEQLLEQAEKAGVHPQLFRQVEIYYSALPAITDERTLFAPVGAFCERIWGSARAYTMTDINRERSGPELPLSAAQPHQSPEETMEYMHLMEQRYAYENELMQAVSQGLNQKAELLMASFSTMSFERRLADPVRNLKNYCIIMNTLLRKAAENGGVHPVYLDKLSSDFARRIENLGSTDAVKQLMDEIFRSYCRLVKKHSTNQYSPLVQKVIIHIDSGLATDLSLKSLAERMNVNASYLSTLFKKETGATVTDYVNQRRVKQAQQLLGSTKLQIQTVAQHCGIADVNYFSKIFKKYVGMTPKEYRRSVQSGT